MESFERVYTVHDWWDGPLEGFADLDGAPHAYHRLWRDDPGDWDRDGHFALSPVSPETLAVALEDWAIWCRWEAAHHAGETGDETHPALPADAARHAELAPLVDRALAIPDGARIAVGEFRSCVGVPPPRNPSWAECRMEVRWQPVD